MSSVVDRAPDECGRGATAHSVALMGTVLAVVAHEAVQRALEREATREVPTAKDHAPVLLQDAALQPLDEAVGPGMARFGARVTNPELATRLIEGAFEFGPTIGQHAADLPAGPLIVRHHDVAQKRGRVGGEMSGQQPGQAVRRGRIAGRNLPDLADAFEVADVEGVQAHKLARLFRLDVPGAAVAGAPQALASTFRQRPGRTRRLMLEHGQPSASGGQPDPAQQPLHRAGRQAHPPGPADIYRDVKNGLLAEQAVAAARPNDVLWTWRFDFESHWATHAADALRALQAALLVHYAEQLPETFGSRAAGAE